MKIVINKCYGGFGLSPKAILRCYELGANGMTYPTQKYFQNEEKQERAFKEWNDYLQNIDNPCVQQPSFLKVFSSDGEFILNPPEKRDDPILIQVVEELGEKSWGRFAKLKVIEVPDGVEYNIDEYDGWESIHEKHRTWE